MTIFRPLAVAAIFLSGLTGCGDEVMEASGFSSLPNGGEEGETYFPVTDSSGGSSGGNPTTGPGGSVTGGDEDSTSVGNSTGIGGTTSGGSTSGSTSGSTGPGPDETGGTGPVIGGCGNGTIDQNEQCDGQNLNGFTCESLGNTGGTLLCDAVTCTFDTSLCTNDMSGGTSG